jgi:adenine phosphoribosyltransferase
MDLKQYIRDIPDFPKKGILFRDISELLRNPQALESVAVEFGKNLNLSQIDAFVGIESRGFILASYLASHFKKGFIPLRKAGKLPPPVIAESYQLEYGSATLEMAPGSGRVVVIDDVLATGGTLQAALNICEKAGYQAEQAAVLIDLTFLNKMRFRGQKIISLIQY